ncbi:MAG: HD domain-containing protein [Rhodospirillaceae bacterium]|nr:HD domain-containing protein [Rhodospirillaceae bacterium]
MAEILGLALVDCRAVAAAAGVHDIGKVSIPQEYLAKPTKLDPLEWSIIKTHSERGYEILRPMESEFPVAEIVYQHHERLDGTGYPRGLRNGAILREAQIIAVADTADSIINSRPYRSALGKDYAIQVLTEERGIKVLPDITDACLVALAEYP